MGYPTMVQLIKRKESAFERACRGTVTDKRNPLYFLGNVVLA